MVVTENIFILQGFFYAEFFIFYSLFWKYDAQNLLKQQLPESINILFKWKYSLFNNY